MARAAVATLLLLAVQVMAAVAVIDDAGTAISLSKPAQRIVSLAPHTTELLFAAGAGNRVVGTASYSDWPPAARDLPRVGDYNAVDYERILGLAPDLVVAWSSGNGKGTIKRLRGLGLKVFVSRPRRLSDIPPTIERLGRLAGTVKTAHTAARHFRQRHHQLATRYRDRPTVATFFQLWGHPIISVNGDQLISQVIALCGGRNVFAELTPLAPRVTTEAVVAADPEAIIAAGRNAERPTWLDDWRDWPSITAVARGNLFSINPDLIHRATPRILDGAEAVCEALASARRHRP